MQYFVYFHAPVESAKAINLHDLSSDRINLMNKNIRTTRTCPIARGKHMCNKFHIKFFFQFPRYVFLMCSKTYVENIPWKPGLILFMHHSEDIKIKLITIMKQRKVLLNKPKPTVSQS